MERDQLNILDTLMRNEAIEEYAYQTTLNTHVREEKQLFSRQQLESRKRNCDTAFPENNLDFDSDNRKIGPKKQNIPNLKQDHSDKENRPDHSNIIMPNDNLSIGASDLCSNCPDENGGCYDKKNHTDPVNQVFTSNDKKTMKGLWKKMEPSSDEKQNTSLKLKWEKNIKPQIQKYTHAIKVKTESIFDDNNNETSLRIIFEAPFVGDFNYKKHYEMIWARDIYQRFICLFNTPFNILRDSDTSEIAYRDSFVNPIIPKVFEDVNDKIRFQVGEIESNLRKQHRNQTRGIKPRVYLGSKHDGILKMYVNACELEIGFLEVVGSPTKVDVKGYYEDLEKLLKERKTTIYVMHRSRGGLNLVDVLTTFTIPVCADQAYVLEEIIKKVDTSDSNEDEELLLASLPNQ
ncbi:14642_t:CDS:10, partial [Racocetra persica]